MKIAARPGKPATGIAMCIDKYIYQYAYVKLLVENLGGRWCRRGTVPEIFQQNVFAGENPLNPTTGSLPAKKSGFSLSEDKENGLHVFRFFKKSATDLLLS